LQALPVPGFDRLATWLFFDLSPEWFRRGNFLLPSQVSPQM